MAITTVQQHDFGDPQWFIWGAFMRVALYSLAEAIFLKTQILGFGDWTILYSWMTSQALQMSVALAGARIVRTNWKHLPDQSVAVQSHSVWSARILLVYVL